MSNAFNTKETMIEFSDVVKGNAYRPYEKQRHESVLFRFLPNFIFKLRWFLIAFFHKKLFRLFGLDFTIGGVIFFLLTLVITPTAEYLIMAEKLPFAASTGWINIFFLCMTITFSSRNTIWALLVGLSVDRALFWHKVFALGFIITSSLHAYSHIEFVDSIFQKGPSLWLSIVLTGVFALWFIRRRFYFWFYVLHIIMICLVLFGVYRHAKRFSLLCCSFWAVDLTLRGIFSLYCMLKGTVFKLRTSKHGNIIELTSKNPIISHLPGQFFFLTVPAVSVIEPHPFTAASLSGENLKFYLRGLGDWTKKLAKLAETQQEVSVIVNGPFGIPTVDIEDINIKHVVLIAGGIGVTFVKPHLENLIDQVQRGRKIKTVTFLWAVRNSELLEIIQFSERVKTAINRSHKTHLSQENAEKPSDLTKEKFLLNYHIFLKTDIEQGAKIDPAIKQTIIHEPLDLGSFLSNIWTKRKVATQSLKVLCCGPKRLVNHCFDLCKVYGYDLHSEYFEF